MARSYRNAPDFGFLPAGGQTGDLIRQHDWEASPLGSPAGWPASLKTAVSLLLASSEPAYIGWGDELISFYNDGYLPILGKGREGIGWPFAALWPHLWDDLGPLIGKTLRGEVQHFADMRLPIGGAPGAHGYFSFTYKPLRDDSGAIAGFYCATRDTTERVLDEQRQSFVLKASELLVSARTLDDIINVLRQTAKGTVDADGIAVILREGELCHYVAEDAIEPLWRGGHFDLHNCVSGWAMLRGETVAIPDISADSRVPHALYAPTFVRSMVMVPIGLPKAFAALGAYWSKVGVQSRSTIDRLESLARLAAIAIDKIRVAEARDRSANLSSAQNRILELAVSNSPLSETLEAIVTTVEQLSTSGVLSSILLYDEASGCLRHGAAPSLPTSYNALIDGLAVGANVGSCGSAIHRNAPVFVSDIATDPLWKDYRDIALMHDLRACWSIPIRSTQGTILGTFAMYHREPREPLPIDLEIVDFVVHTAGLVIERAQAELAQRQSEERLRLATNHAEVGFWDVDEINQELYWSGAVKAMFGVSQQRSVSMTDFFEGLHPDDRERTARAYEAAADPVRRELYDIEYRTVGQEDGVIRWVAAKGRGVFNEEGQCVRVTGTAIDISQRKAMEMQLRELNDTLELRVADALSERQTFASAIESSPAPTLICNDEYRIVAVNAACVVAFDRAYGVHPKVGINLLAMMDGQPEARARIAATWARALNGEEIIEVVSFGSPGPEQVHLEMRFTRLIDRDGRQVGAVQTAYDVTERVQAEAELARAQIALRQSQKMEAMGQLTGGVAHDFNNLLTPIVGSLDVLQRRGLGSDREQRLIAGAVQSAERAKTLVQRLLAFARRQPLQAVPVDVVKLVRGMAGLVSSTIGPQIKVVVIAAGDLPAAQVDPNQLEMALLNLAVNARDAMPEGGTLTMSVIAEAVTAGQVRDLAAGSYIQLSVSDTGTGMDDETLARAVEPFFSTKGIGRGTGLGLSMVDGLASQLGGTLTIQSKLGVGTSMELWLPQSQIEVSDDQATAEAHPLPVSSHSVLLVDDEPLVRMTTADMLSDLGYEVIEAESAEQALKMVADGLPFDLLVTDHLMPGLTGIELAQTLRITRPALPVLLVSGYAEFEGVDPGLSRLVKPFRKSELAHGLAELVARQEASVSLSL